MEPVDRRANDIGRVQRGYATRRQLAEVASISASTGGRHSQRRARLHTTTAIGQDETTRLRGLPCTVAARTLLDIAAGRRRLVDVLSRLPQDLAQLGSPLEVIGVLALRRAGAPAPVLQYRIRDAGGAVVKRVDAAWPAARTVVEFDGAAYHDTSDAQRHDREVRARMRALGWTVEVLRRADVDGPALAALAARLRQHLAG